MYNNKSLIEILKDVCDKAIAYDLAIQKYSMRQDAQQWTASDNLDSLYFDWVEAVKEARKICDKKGET